MLIMLLVPRIIKKIKLENLEIILVNFVHVSIYLSIAFSQCYAFTQVSWILLLSTGIVLTNRWEKGGGRKDPNRDWGVFEHPPGKYVGLTWNHNIYIFLCLSYIIYCKHCKFGFKIVFDHFAIFLLLGWWVGWFISYWWFCFYLDIGIISFSIYLSVNIWDNRIKKLPQLLCFKLKSWVFYLRDILISKETTIWKGIHIDLPWLQSHQFLRQGRLWSVATLCGLRFYLS